MKLTTLLCILPFAAECQKMVENIDQCFLKPKLTSVFCHRGIKKPENIHSCEGAYRFICPKPTLEVVEGDDILLQGRLDPLVDLSTYTVDWRRPNKDVVHAYRHEQDLPAAQLDQYRGRTTLNHEDLKRGVVTLLISSAQLSDSGLYRCYVPKLGAGCTVDVNIAVKKDEQNRTKTSDSSTSGPPVEEETHPDNRDAAKMEAVSPEVVVAAVVGGILAAAVVGGVIFILVKLGKIRSHVLTGSCKRREQEETKPNHNNYEMGKLKTQNNRGG